MKKRILLVALVLVAIASTIGVGFASWVISRPATETRDGQFYVETVTDESLHLVVTPEEDTVLSFYGPSQGGNNPQAWLQYQDGTAEGRSFEKLGVVYRFDLYRQSTSEDHDLQSGSGDDVKYYKRVSDAYDLNITFSEGTLSDNTFTVSADAAAIRAAGKGDLVSGATFRQANQYTGAVVVENNISDLVGTKAENEVTWSLTLRTSSTGVAYLYIDYTWGTHFSGQNPYTFYNDNHKADDVKAAVMSGNVTLYEATTYAADAEAVLKALAEQGTGISFQLYVKVSAADKVVNNG